jgi:glutamate synthase (NADPH/NADH) large chain
MPAAVGNRPCRNPADAGAQRPALAHRRAGRWRAAHRPRRVIGALLGADEFGFSTAPLIAAGCIMMRKCHLNTCPVGIATQDPVLRKRFKGTPEHVINYFFFVAEEVRELMAAMGFRKFDEMIGQSDCSTRKRDRALEGAGWISPSSSTSRRARRRDRWTERQNHPIDDSRSQADREGAAGARNKTPVQIEIADQERRPVGRRHAVGRSRQALRPQGPAGRHDLIKLTGTAGQSFGAFVAKRRHLRSGRRGNDYVGKGLSAAAWWSSAEKNSGSSRKLDHRRQHRALWRDRGRMLLPRRRRRALRRAQLRRVAVVEGVGDHGCEYMTGGVVVVLGEDRPQLRGRHVGRHRLCSRRGRLTFETRCNLAMVELEPVPEEDDLLEKLHHHGGDLEHKGRVDVSSDMTRIDEERLFQLISNHPLHRARRGPRMILDNWETYRPMFREGDAGRVPPRARGDGAMRMQGVAAE